MKIKIFMLAFCVGFTFFFSAAAVFVWRYSGGTEPPAAEESSETEVFAKSAALLLIFEDGGAAGPFTLVCLDPKSGRIPVLTFPAEVVLETVPGAPTAAEAFAALSPEEFAAAAEKELEIGISGWFIWTRSTCETVMPKAGSFDYILPENLHYSGGGRYIDLAAGVQSITGKKLYDLVTYPSFDPAARCDVTSRLISLFFGKRLRRFLPENSALSAAVYSSTKNSADAFFRAELRGTIKALCAGKSAVASHVTCELAEDESGGLHFTEATRARIKKYFPPKEE